MHVDQVRCILCWFGLITVYEAGVFSHFEFAEVSTRLPIRHDKTLLSWPRGENEVQVILVLDVETSGYVVLLKGEKSLPEVLPDSLYERLKAWVLLRYFTEEQSLWIYFKMLFEILA